MFESIANFFKKLVKSEAKVAPSKDTAKERLHLVLMQDRANVSADFLELMKQEIIEVIKKYIEVEESAIDVRLTNEIGEDGTKGAPSLYANIPILNIKNNMKNNIEKSQEDLKQKNNKEKNISKQEEVKKDDENKEAKDSNEEKEYNTTNEESLNNKEKVEEKKEENKEEIKEDKKQVNNINDTNKENNREDKKQVKNENEEQNPKLQATKKKSNK